MNYYDLSPDERKQRKAKIKQDLMDALSSSDYERIIQWIGNNDTHTRKVAYLALRKLYCNENQYRISIQKLMDRFIHDENEKIRQTIVYTAGEIGCYDFDTAEKYIEAGLFDPHHSVRNAATGALKVAGNKNDSILDFCQKHIQSAVPEVRRLVCHGLELRGRTRPKEILPLLKQLQHDEQKRVHDMLVHVLGQISYKKGCFYLVCDEVRSWENECLFSEFKKETIEVHESYAKFSELSVKEVSEYLLKS